MISFGIWIVAGIMTQPFAATCGMMIGGSYKYGFIDTLPYVVTFAITGQVTGLLSIIVVDLISAAFSSDNETEDSKNSNESNANDTSGLGNDSSDENSINDSTDEDGTEKDNKKPADISAALMDEESIKKLDEDDQPVIHN
jgi:hypothetical protein